MSESTTTVLATAITHHQSMDPIQKYARFLGQGIEQCLPTCTNPVRCCGAFAHASVTPASSDSCCSADSREPEVSPNSKAVAMGRRAAVLHRNHHFNNIIFYIEI
jgi:hypothetical protein